MLSNEAIQNEALAIKKELSRRRLLDFTLYTKPDYQTNWHHKAYADKLDEFAQGKIKNLMIFMPPQHGKSELSSRRLPAFMLGLNPNLKIALVGYNSTIASKFNRDVQRILDDSSYKELFSQTTIKDIGQRGGYIRTSEEFEIVDNQGFFISVGVGGGLTSRTVDLLIMDDLYKDSSTAWSETIRNSTLDWYETVGKTRLHNDSQQLIVFTRWHEEDLAGYLLRTEPDNWQVVMFPAVKIGKPNKYDPREDGEALWEEKHSIKKLAEIRKNNPVVFDSLYQQNPTPKEGLLLPAVELNRFRKSQIQGTTPTAIISFCDTADMGDDSLAHPIGYVFGQDVYIVDVNFTKEPIEITQPLVALKLDMHRIQSSLFESNNGGKGYALKVRELKKGSTSISWQHTTQNKHTRIIMNSGVVKEHFFFLVDEEQSDEYKRYFHELTHYPINGKVKHDDAIDSTTGLATMIARTDKIIVY